MNGFIFSKKDNEVADFFYMKVDLFRLMSKRGNVVNVKTESVQEKLFFFDNGNVLERFEHSQDAGY